MGVFSKISQRKQKQAKAYFERVVLPIITSASTTDNKCVKSLIHFIASSISSLNLDLYQRTKNGDRIINWGHNAAKLVAAPNNRYGPTTLMYKMAQSYLVDGNIYLLRKSIDTLDVLFPQYVQITRSALGFKLYNYALTGETFTENQIIHTFAPQYDDGEKGHSIIEVDRDLIELDNLLYLYIDTYFRNSAGERVVFKLQEGVYKDLKTEAIQKEFDRYLQEKVNAFAAGKPFTLKSGIEIESITQTTNKESELQSLLDRVEAKIALALLFPQSLATGNYGNNLIEQQNQYARQCLFPITEVQKEGLNRLLTPEERVYLSFEYGFDNLLMPITKELYEMVIDAARGGILTKNEGRRLLKLPRYTGDQSEVGDVLAWESNLVPALNKNLDLYFANAQQTIEKDKKKSENANPNTK